VSIEVSCTNPNCKKRYRLSSAATGKSVRCRACGETFIAASAATVVAAKDDEVLEPAWTEIPAPAAIPGVSAHSVTVSDQRVGRFVIRGKLGAGAFGTVYRAYDPQLDRVVALKVPNPGVMADAKRAERFLREAKAAANLRHPHIVPVFDAGQDGDTYYIASAFIKGQSLADTIPEGGTKFTRAARLVRELADALAYAHEQGIVHRDVKPQNVMVDEQDRVHLMDFGLAARHDEESRLTADGTVMGTAAYMAPEQAAGQTGEARAAFDQYAVGVVLYELLTGTVPFKGPVPVVIHNHLHTEPEPPRHLRPDVPRDLETICLKALSKRPEDRYPDCQELAADLRRWLEGEPVTARRRGVVERVARWVKKEPKLAAAATVIAVLLCAGAALSVVSAERARRDAQAQDRLRRDADAAAAQAEKDATAARDAEKKADEALGQARTAGASAVTEAERAKEALKTAEDERKQAEAARAKTAEALKTAEDEKKSAEQAKQTADDARKQAETALADLNKAQRAVAESAYPSQIRTASQLLDLKSYKEAEVVLGQCAKELRESEWHYLNLLCAARGKTGFPYAAYSYAAYAGASKEYALASLSTDGRRLAAFDPKALIVVLFDVNIDRARMTPGPLEYWGIAGANTGTDGGSETVRQIRVTGGALGRNETHLYLDWLPYEMVAAPRKGKKGNPFGDEKEEKVEEQWRLTAQKSGSTPRGLHCTEQGYVLAFVPGSAIQLSRKRHTVPANDAQVIGTTSRSMAVSGDGKWIATGEGYLYEVDWDPFPGNPLRPKANYLTPFQKRYAITAPQVGTLAVSSDGRVAFTEKGTGGLYVCDPVEVPPAKNGALPKLPAGTGGQPGMAGGPGMGGRPASGQVPAVRDVPGKWTNVNLLRFSRDGRRLAFIEGSYGPIYLVDTASGALLMTLRVGGGVLDIGFDAESRSVMAVTANGQLHVWYAFEPKAPKP
jgi:tRNA A-37 threonylcarbamoyl transferase component Bud32